MVLFEISNCIMNLRRTLTLAIVALCSVVANTFAAAEAHPFLHPLFCDHAVLQRELSVPVWGWSQPGDKVTVSFAGQTRTTVAGADGKWMVRLKAMPASSQPRSMTVQSAKSQIKIDDVLVGDVWLCSGQSNMEMGIGNCNVPNEIAQANYPNIRLLTIPKLVASSPVDCPKCAWLQCNSNTIMQGVWGGFSAAGYFFGRELHRELNIPIGLIHSSWGGTVAEAWTSYETLAALPELTNRLAGFVASTNFQTDFATTYENWYHAGDPGTKQGWEKPDADVTSWKTVDMPQAFELAGLPDFDGIVWFRCEFDVPADWAGKSLSLHLGPVDDIDTTWVNGVKVGQMNRVDMDRLYTVPGNIVKAGRNVVAVRCLDTGGMGGLIGKPEQLTVRLSDDNSAAPISLAGKWKMRDSIALSKLPTMPFIFEGNNPNITTVLYNGMIAPLVPFAIKGAIWYQGESNADRAAQYRKLLPAMIADWQKHFGLRRFPFYIVQLANFQATAPQPRDNDWAELREAQALTARHLPHSGLAVAIDIGDAKDIHPKNKMEVGRRLALCALADTYGRKTEASGPTYKSMKITEQGIRLTFDHLGGGLVAKGEKLTGFAIAGEDQKFVWANARIEGNTILISSPVIAEPVAVRYAWDVNPVCDLYNQAGLPAVPFRTDDWPLMTRDRN